MPLDRKLALVLPGTGMRTIRALTRRGPVRIVVEDVILLERLLRDEVGPCSLLSDLIPYVRDGYDSQVQAQTAVLMRQLQVALGAEQWRYADVSLWDAVMPDFLWRCLDNLFQAVDAARQLLDNTAPTGVIVTGLDSCLARALVAVARARCLRVEVLQDRVPGQASVLSALAIPYLGHFRDCLKVMRYDWKAQPVCRAPFVLLNHALRNFLVIQPVFRELQRKFPPERILVVQTGSDGEQEVRASGLACQSFEGYASLAEGLKALSSVWTPVRFLTSGLWKERVAASGLAWDGVPLETLAETEISFELPRLLGNTVREIACARRMLIREKPALVVMTEDRSSFTRAVAFSAKGRDIPSLMVQWGPIALNSAWLARGAADVAAVEGEAAAEVLRSCEDGTNVRVVVTGQPKYDVMREQAAAASRSETCKRYGFDPGRPIVLYASPFVSEESAPMRRSVVEEQKLANEIEAVCDTIRYLPGVQLVVKPHPNEGTRLHHEVASRLQSLDLHLMPKHASIYPVLFVCDAVVTHHSTVGMEAVLLGKPLVIANLTGRSDAIPYVEGGVAIGAYETKDVSEALRKALYDPETRRRMVKSRPSFMRRYGFLGEGSATGRMLDLMLTMADSHSTN